MQISNWVMSRDLQLALSLRSSESGDTVCCARWAHCDERLWLCPEPFNASLKTRKQCGEEIPFFFWLGLRLHF